MPDGRIDGNGDERSAGDPVATGVPSAPPGLRADEIPDAHDPDVTFRHPTWMRVVALICLVAAIALIFASIP